MLSDLLVCGVAYSVAQLVTLPFDFMKVQAQLRFSNKHTENSRPLLFGREVVSAKGFSGLYVGYQAQLIRSIIYGTSRSFIYSTLLAKKTKSDRYGTASTFDRTLFQMTAAGLGGFFAAPFDFILLRQQADFSIAEPRNYSGILDAYTKINAELGSNGIWYMSSANSMKYAALAAGMLPIYDYFIEFFPRILGEVFFNKEIAMIPAVIAGSLFSLPFDNIKNKLQAQLTGGTYKGFGDAYSKTLAREGFLGNYVGFWHYSARIYIGSWLTITLVDFIRSGIYG